MTKRNKIRSAKKRAMPLRADLVSSLIRPPDGRAANSLPAMEIGGGDSAKCGNRVQTSAENSHIFRLAANPS